MASCELGDKLYFYDRNDKESVGTILEYHAVRCGRKKDHYFYIAKLKGGKIVRVDDRGWEDFYSSEYPDVTSFPLSPINKGAIVHASDDEHGVVFEAVVCGYHHFGCEGYFSIRFKKFIKEPSHEHGYSGANKNFYQSVPERRLKLITNGTGIRLVRKRK